MNEYLTTKELAERWRYHVAYIRQLIARGKIATMKVGGKNLIPKDWVIEQEQTNLSQRATTCHNVPQGNTTKIN